MSLIFGTTNENMNQLLYFSGTEIVPYWPIKSFKICPNSIQCADTCPCSSHYIDIIRAYQKTMGKSGGIAGNSILKTMAITFLKNRDGSHHRGPSKKQW